MTAAQALDDYLAALLRGDRRAATAVLDGAREQGMDTSSLYMEVLQPALWEIGRLWQANEISVADEHLATAITQAAMARLFDAAVPGMNGSAPTLIAACADVERHEIGLRMVCDLLELEGWDTTFLGATVPIESLVEMVRRRRPEVVALSASLPPHLPRLRAMVEAVRGALPDEPPLIVVGGRPFLEHPGLAQRLGADLTASSATEAVRLLRERVES